MERIQAALSTWVSNAGANATVVEFLKLNPNKNCDGFDNGTAAWNTLKIGGAACLDIQKLDSLNQADIVNPYGHKWVLVGGEWGTTGTDNASKIGIGTGFYIASSATSRFACNIDSILDDKYLLFGDARSNAKELRTNNTTPQNALKAQNAKTDASFTTCDKWDNALTGSGPTAGASTFVAYNLGL
jgi:hypothetical protein